MGGGVFDNVVGPFIHGPSTYAFLHVHLLIPVVVMAQTLWRGKTLPFFACLFCFCVWAVSQNLTGLLSFARCYVSMFTLWTPTFLAFALMSGTLFKGLLLKPHYRLREVW